MAPGANGSANTGSSDTVTVTGGANGDIDVSGFWTRYESVKYGDVMKNVLIEVSRSISTLRACPECKD